VANTGIRLSNPLIRSIFATGGRGAMRPKQSRLGSDFGPASQIHAFLRPCAARIID
jgi:hypothetical protein